MLLDLINRAGEILLEERLISIVAKSEVTITALKAVRRLNLSSWCIGAGAIRNLVWDHLHGFEVATKSDDIDVVFYDANDLSLELEQSLTLQLDLSEPEFAWDVVNQAAVHTWIRPHPGKKMMPFRSLAEGVASWPEVATCVGVTLTTSGKIEVISPHGLIDLFEMVIRWNPERVPREVYEERVADKRFSERWPRVKVLPCL
ncbi:nucleotidyltransferase family protein [Pseudomonas sp. SL4(2022)]|uniref:nucleotidyltransferase family protein n=1 Tax=Pseudomonas sp. SL4(2022) TaxID=2994661 RepID=UPI00226D6DD5|nr:nucleotidyltransferase family protein [Pseudomonas sp. SL4(2022)]WAC45288.1 nucleotidyltransferase family protein [Pseudomonas sp. SL4(2022)]